jgi:hypothetical protein
MTVNDDDIQRIIAEAEEEARGMERVQSAVGTGPTVSAMRCG